MKRRNNINIYGILTSLDSRKIYHVNRALLLALKFFDCSKERGDALTFDEKHHQTARMQRSREEPQKPLPTGIVQRMRKCQEMKVYPDN